ncbi:MAG TPA: threonine/serine dehydratase [Acidimicrobiales bacterium]|nr:threonine/serine dehydratase [Acidimicrobiales bacterium]
MSADTVSPLVDPDDVERAAEHLSGRVRVTPVVDVGAGELGLPCSAVLKLELLQHTGSFKPRGAFHRVLTAGAIPDVGLIAASGGNHGAAVAYVARALGHRAEVFVPSTSPAMKRDRISSFGAEVVVVDGYYDDAQRAADERAQRTGAFAIHPYDHAAVVAGQGTLGRELDVQMPALDTVVVACGGGGLIAGVAAWFRERVRVVSVEPESSQCLRAARLAGHPVPVEVAGLAADSLGAGRIGAVPWTLVEHYVDEAVTVEDDEIRAAQRALWAELRLVAEPGGAAALAALRSGAYRPSRGERVSVVVCGANCDPASVQ